MLNSSSRGHGEHSTRNPLSQGIPRRLSQETLSTLVNDDTQGVQGAPPPAYEDIDARTSSDLNSLITNDSDETIYNSTKIFNTPISSFTKRREFPVVSHFMYPGAMVFKSLEDLQQYKSQLNDTAGSSSSTPVHPILHTSVPVLGLFKKNSPFMVIYKYDSVTGTKVEYCKVYFKILDNKLTCYILVFAKGMVSFENHFSPVILLNNNSCKPSVDFEFQNTKVRITGVSGATSTFGKGLLKTLIMERSSPNLSDGLEVNFNNQNIIKTIKVNVSKENRLAQSLISNKFNHLTFSSLMNKGRQLVNVPFATYIDNGDKRIGSMLVRHCTINCLDVGENNGDEISENTMILTCINLVLREQEYRKNKGNNKPTFVSLGAMLQSIERNTFLQSTSYNSRDF